MFNIFLSLYNIIYMYDVFYIYIYITLYIYIYTLFNNIHAEIYLRYDFFRFNRLIIHTIRFAINIYYISILVKLPISCNQIARIGCKE